MNAQLPRINGAVPRDPPLFMPSNVRKFLRAADGAKFSARQITERLGFPIGTWDAPSGAVMNVIRILAQLADRGEVLLQMPNAELPEITYWMEPPRCNVCGKPLHEHEGRVCG
jgi:hypothetical protein